MFGTKKAAEALEEDLRSLRRDVDELKSARKRLELEWEELYDKVRRQMARMSKRAAVDLKESEDLTPPTTDASLMDGLDPISRKIIARRGNRTGT